MFLPQRWRRQPVGPVGLNQHSPLADGLVACWLPNMSTALVAELVSNTLDATSGTITQCYSNEAVGLDLTAASNNVNGGARTINVVTTDRISVAVICVPRSVTTRGDIFTRWTNGSAAGDQFNLIVGLTSGKFIFYTASGGGATSNSGNSATTLVNGTQYLLGGEQLGSAGISCYIDGKLEASGASSSVSTTPTTAYIIGDNANGDGNFNGEVYLACVWNRPLFNSGWAEFGTNPWQIFAPLPTRRFFGVAGGSPDVTLALSGVAATASVGTAVPNSTAALTGAAGASAVGTAAPSITIGLTGTPATGAVGNVTAPGNVTVALSGIGVTGSAGTIAPAFSIAASGAAATASVGSTGPTILAILSGHAVTGSAGIVVPNSIVALSGASCTAAVGTVTFVTGSAVTVALSGVSATCAVGLLGAAGGLPTTPAPPSSKTLNIQTPRISFDILHPKAPRIG